MSKMKELFVDNINKAMTAADVMNDINAKPMAYASIAHALAVYLNGERTNTAIETVEDPLAINTQEIIAETTEPTVVNQAPEEPKAPVVEEVQPQQENIHEEALRLSEKNKEVIKAIDDALANKTSEWQLPYDENGLPYLNDEDYSKPERVLAYQEALTPEVKAKIREIEIAQGMAVLNETTEQAPETPQAPEVTEPVATFTQEDLDALEYYKTTFDYANNPSQLDNLYHNFTDGLYSNVADVTPQTINPFLIFIREELNKAYQSVEEWKASWITKEGLDALISQAYGVEGATLETYLHDGNVFWFLDHVALYNANAWFASYQESMGVDALNNYVKQLFEDNSLTINDINNENVIGFVSFVQSMTAQ